MEQIEEWTAPTEDWCGALQDAYCALGAMSQRLTSTTGAWAKSLTLRVTTTKPCSSAVAAIRPAHCPARSSTHCGGARLAGTRCLAPVQRVSEPRHTNQRRSAHSSRRALQGDMGVREDLVRSSEQSGPERRLRRFSLGLRLYELSCWCDCFSGIHHDFRPAFPGCLSSVRLILRRQAAMPMLMRVPEDSWVSTI